METCNYKKEQEKKLGIDWLKNNNFLETFEFSQLLLCLYVEN